jgi:hypothetical protein
MKDDDVEMWTVFIARRSKLRDYFLGDLWKCLGCGSATSWKNYEDENSIEKAFVCNLKTRKLISGTFCCFSL